MSRGFPQIEALIGAQRHLFEVTCSGLLTWQAQCSERALSVSISAKLSPAATSSPTFFFHDAMFPGTQ